MAGIGLLRTFAGSISRKIATAHRLRWLVLLGLSRQFGTSTASAAQPQFDHDRYGYNYEEDDGSPRSRECPFSAPVPDTEGSVPVSGVQWAFIGNPSVKKRVYAEKLSELLQVHYISMASLVRQELSPSSSLHKQIANAVNRGEIVPEEIIISLLSKRLEDGYYRGEIGFILDGIPRTQVQAEILDQLVDIDLVVNFKCMEDGLLRRHGNDIFCHPQRVDDHRNSAFSSFDMSSQDIRPNFPLGNTGNIWKEKVHVYAKQMKQVEDYYRKQKKLKDFEAGGGTPPAEIWRGLLAVLQLQHINATHSKVTSP